MMMRPGVYPPQVRSTMVRKQHVSHVVQMWSDDDDDDGGDDDGYEEEEGEGYGGDDESGY